MRGQSVDRSGLDSQSVVAASQILDEGLSSGHDAGHRSVFIPRMGRSRAFNRPRLASHLMFW